MLTGWIKKPNFWLWLAVAAGIALRTYHYARNPSVWHDEAALILNVLDKSYLELLGPLFFHEAGAPGFLWLLRTVYLGFGDSTFALRLIPFFASCTALLVFVPVAQRVLGSFAAVAVFLFAFSDMLCWHACEAKQYAVDVFVATSVLAIYLATSRRPLSVRLAVFGFLAPIVIFLSYPGCFLYGGLLVVLLLEVWQAKEFNSWIGYCLLSSCVFVSFALLLFGPVAAQRSAAMDQCWLKQFPPWDRPWKVPFWLVDSTLDIVRYVCGPAGKVVALFGFVGVASLVWCGKGRLTVLLTVPVLAALAASFLKAYPYGGTRVMAYAAPAVFLLVGAGTPVCLGWLRRRPAVIFSAVLFLLAWGPAMTLFHVARPWGRTDCSGAAEYVLQRCEPNDRITANGWEYLYYFRRTAGVFQPLDRLTFPVPARLWVCFSGLTPAERRNIGQLLSLKQGPILIERHFERTCVFLLDAPEPARLALMSDR